MSEVWEDWIDVRTRCSRGESEVSWTLLPVRRRLGIKVGARAEA